MAAGVEPGSTRARVGALVAVLRVGALGERDRYAVLLTEQGRKLRVAASGARVSQRRFGASLVPGAVGEAMIARGRGAMLRLEGFDALRDALGTAAPWPLFYVAWACELVDQLVPEGAADPALFAVLVGFLAHVRARAGDELARGEDWGEAVVEPAQVRRFEAALLQSLGVAPPLHRCVVCASHGALRSPARTAGPGVDLDAVVAVRPGCGGALCAGHEEPTSTPISAAALQLARAVFAGEVEAYAQAGPHERRAVRDLLAGAVRAQLHAPLRSLEYARELRGAQPRIPSQRGE